MSMREARQSVMRCLRDADAALFDIAESAARLTRSRGAARARRYKEVRCANDDARRAMPSDASRWRPRYERLMRAGER